MYVLLILCASDLPTGLPTLLGESCSRGTDTQKHAYTHVHALDVRVFYWKRNNITNCNLSSFPPCSPSIVVPFFHPALLSSLSYCTMTPFFPRLFISPIFLSPIHIKFSFIFFPISYFASLLMMLLQLCYAVVSVWGTKLPRVSPTIAVSTLRCLREYVSSGLEENAAERLWDALWGSSGNFNKSNAVLSLSHLFV